MTDDRLVTRLTPGLIHSDQKPGFVYGGPPFAAIFFEDYRIEDFPPKIDREMFPHICPRCGSPAYIGGMNTVDCSGKCH